MNENHGRRSAQSRAARAFRGARAGSRSANAWRAANDSRPANHGHSAADSSAAEDSNAAVDSSAAEDSNAAVDPNAAGDSRRDARGLPHDPATLEQNCRNDALRILTIRERTRRGLVTALVRRNHDRITASAVVDQLAHAGWVDDGRYARLRLQSAVRARPESMRALTLRLRQDGCDDETIRAAMQDAKERIEGFDELELARRLVQKKLRTFGRDHDKLVRALVRNGFPADVVRQALRQIDRGKAAEREHENGR